MYVRVPRIAGIKLKLSICLLLLPPILNAQQIAPLITQPVNESQLTQLKGNTHPLAQPQFDIGTALPNMQLNRMLLVLKRSPQQDFALHKLIDDQQDKASPNYHKWLTPDSYGTQFGAPDQDLQLITGWLQTSGFQVNRVTHSRTVIEFSGTEAQLESAFHTQIHQYLVDGQQHWANASDPQIPAALAPAVAGVLSLHNFPRKPMSKILGTYSPKTRQLNPVNPQFTLNYGCYPNGTCYAVGPADFGTIYNVQSLWNSGIDGTGQTIAIVGESDINIQDVRDFRSTFGLPPKDPTIIYDGPNPGLMFDESEADIDVQWSGAIAPNATIDFVVSQSTETTFGVDLSALYIIDHNLAPVMSESYGECELGIGTTGNQFYNLLWSQAAAQGITAILASGDSGSAGCDFGGGPAQFGLAVSGFASTPFNVSIGGTDFNDFLHETTYWNTSNTSPTLESAKGYIPETTWDVSCTNSIFLKAFGFGTNAESDCNNPNIGGVFTVGGSGGVSNCTSNNGQNPSSCSGGYAKPSWQVAPGVPADGRRDIPDVSLFASNGLLNSFYVFCESDASANCTFGQYAAAGGTSFGAPAFAGIMALVNQQMQTPQGQGNPNYVLYKLGAQQSASSCNSSNGSGANCVFNDVTSGTIAMPCAVNSPNCVVKTAGHQYGILSGYATTPGYDLATGLGSINVANLVNKWNSVTFRPTTTTLSLSPATGLTHGQPVTVTSNVAPSTGSGTPTGDVSLLTSTGIAVDGFTLSNGAISGTTNLLPGGSYTVSAHYIGDPTFGGSNSPAVNVTVGKENSSPQIELVTFDWLGNLISSNASTAVYGSPYLLRVNVLNNAASLCQPNPLGQAGCPTGNVTLTDNGSPLDGGTFALNSLGYTEDQVVQLPGGNHSVKAQYAGDNSFNPSSTMAAYSITPAPTQSMLSTANSATVGTTLGANMFIQATSSGVPPTGNVSFFVDGVLSPPQSSVFAAGRCGNNLTWCVNANGSVLLTSSGSHTITATYNGDANYASSSAAPVSVKGVYPTTITLNASTVSPAPNTPVTLTAFIDTPAKNLSLTGSVFFYYMTRFTGSPATIPGSIVLTPTTDVNGNSALQAVLTFTPSSNYETVWAQFGGDPNFLYSASNSAAISVAGNDFSLTSGSPLNIIQGSVGTTSVTIDGQAAYTGTVNFTFASLSGLPKEASAVFALQSIAGSGESDLTITTTAPHLLSQRGMGTVSISLLATVLPIGGILTFGISKRRGVRPYLITMITISWLVIGVACGGGSNTGGGGEGFTDPGTPKGTYPIIVTANSSSGVSHTTTFQLIVQ